MGWTQQQDAPKKTWNLQIGHQLMWETVSKREEEREEMERIADKEGALTRARQRSWNLMSRETATLNHIMVTDGVLDAAIMWGRWQRRTPSGWNLLKKFYSCPVHFAGIQMTDSTAGCSSLWRAATCCRAASTSPPTSPTPPGLGTAGWLWMPLEGGCFGSLLLKSDLNFLLGLVMSNTCGVWCLSKGQTWKQEGSTGWPTGDFCFCNFPPFQNPAREFTVEEGRFPAVLQTCHLTGCHQFFIYFIVCLQGFALVRRPLHRQPPGCEARPGDHENCRRRQV